MQGKADSCLFTVLYRFINCYITQNTRFWQCFWNVYNLGKKEDTQTTCSFLELGSMALHSFSFTSAHQSIYLFSLTSIFLNVLPTMFYPAVSFCIYLSIYLSVCLSVYLSQSIYLSIYLSICLSVCLFVLIYLSI